MASVGDVGHGGGAELGIWERDDDRRQHLAAHTAAAGWKPVTVTDPYQFAGDADTEAVLVYSVGRRGLATLRRLREQHPSLALVALVDDGDENDLRYAYAAGATGVITLGWDPDDILDALAAAQGGAAWVPGGLMGALVSRHAIPPPGVDLGAPELRWEAQRAHGVTDDDLAAQYGYSDGRTIRRRLDHWRHRLGAHNNNHAQLWLVSWGVLTPPALQPPGRTDRPPPRSRRHGPPPNHGPGEDTQPPSGPQSGCG